MSRSGFDNRYRRPSKDAVRTVVSRVVVPELATGDRIASGHLRLCPCGAPIPDEPDASLIEVDADGATRIGPLPHGLTAMALDMPTLAQMRIPNVSVTGADPILDGGTIIVQSGSTLYVDLLDASGLPVRGQLVLLEDLLPRPIGRIDASCELAVGTIRHAGNTTAKYTDAHMQSFDQESLLMVF
jgi:hypothetical protein